MSRPLLFVLLLALSLLQFTVFARYAPFGAAPNILLVVLFFRCTRSSLQESLAWVFLFGLVLDILGMDPLGIHSLAMIPMVLAAQPLRARPWAINPMSVLLLIAVAALFNNLFLSVVRGGVNLVDVLIQTVMQLIFVPIVYAIYRRIYKR
ncbi:MAG: rod shape-determining protein MreD [Thermomicrobiales bacterium]|nr:rod shape-determining protein MreD [Thermomicrobiales bacterium]MCO5224900.1 rod shape-determining protein MreD [Thermomicrobiales bacterium]MCO5228458.1 rod shape-determining protein MreD [Thermomicrobiales bacterium]